MGFATWLLLFLYLLSFLTLGRGLLTRFLEPLGRLHMKLPVRTFAWRFWRLLFVCVAGGLLGLYLLVLVFTSPPMSPDLAIGMAALIALLLNSALSSLFAPVLLVGSEGLRIGAIRIPWTDIFHWEKSGRGYSVFHRRPQGGLSRFWIPVPQPRVAKLNRVLSTAAPQIPESEPSRTCVSCCHYNPLHATQCEECGSPLVTRDALASQMMGLRARQRKLRWIYWILFLGGMTLLFLFQIL